MTNTSPDATPPVGTPSVAATAPMRRSLRWLLIGSLTVNCLVIGLGLGAVVANRHSGGPRAMELALGPFARALDDADRRAIGRQLMENGGMRPPARQVREAAMGDLVAALRADPFSADTVRALMESQRDWVQTAQETAQEAVLARIVLMTPEARLAFADRLERELGHMRGDEGMMGD